jgi:hypothetical protein
MVYKNKITVAKQKNQNGGFRRHLGLSGHFDFIAWQHCFYFYIPLELQHIIK